MIIQSWFDLSSDEMIKAQARLFEIENEFFNTGLRNITIVGTSKIDFLLGDILTAFMKKPYSGASQNIAERITFDTKINLCYGLGLIDESLSKVIHFLRKSRNEFAHQPIAKEIDKKELYKVHNNLRDEYMYMILYSAYSNNNKSMDEVQCIFTTLVMYVVGLLNFYVERVKKIDDEKILRLKSTSPTCRVKTGKGMELIEPINM